ncbi:hypothetical protein [Pseudomonas sp. MWU16-30323]|uniref:hypothetical protein n=1 Tax=Pseudomonas sp. MWU16-30323 TaxID=2878094 RepID=UPI001CFB73A7|nr:hypothetical protein [Pseudomonas sp. MWU16-30323]
MPRLTSSISRVNGGRLAPFPPGACHERPTDIDNDEEEFAETTLIEAIENQIESDNPPAAKATFNKLTLVGYEREDILQMMAHVLAIEIDALLEEDRAFNTEWYETALRALPELPPEKQ